MYASYKQRIVFYYCRILTSIIILTIVSIHLNAHPVDSITAKKVAQNFLADKKPAIRKTRSKPATDLIHIAGSDSLIAYYVFQRRDTAFAIISANDFLPPVIGYSVNSLFSYDQASPAFTWFLRNLQKQAANIYSQEGKKRGEPNNNYKTWQDILHDRKKRGPNDEVEPLLGDIAWGQGCYYNDKCQRDWSSARCNRTPVGCGAVAMGQIMKYWNYPVQGIGNHTYEHDDYGTLSADFENTTYDWVNMPAQLDQNSTATEVEAIATLLYHCGVSVEMQFGSEGSSSYTTDAKNAFSEYFGFIESNIAHLHKDDYTNSDWIEVLKNELDNGRPLFYAGGVSPVRHAWVCDGYDNNMFHMNWGWDGLYNDGYYVTDLDPDEDFTDNQEILIGISPHLLPVDEQDSLALVSFYNQTNGDQWKENTNWLETTVNKWYGVTVINNRVVKLELQANQLSGTLSQETGNLENLIYLNLEENLLSGNIPPEIGNLSQLQYLYLANNQLSGSIPPEIGDLSKLYFLDVSNNEINGFVPAEIGQINSLFYLNLYYNQFTFQDLLENLEDLNEITYVLYEFQDTLAVTQSFFEYQAGDQISINIKDISRLTNSNNAYTWVKPADRENWWTVVGQGETLEFSEFDENDTGFYHCQITNSQLPDVALFTEGIYLDLVNSIPVADAGADQEVNESEMVNLDGTASFDADDDPITYRWKAPSGVVLSDDLSASPEFTAPEVHKDTIFTFILVVNDGNSDSKPDKVNITIKHVNKPPVAEAGENLVLDEGEAIMLNGTASADPDILDSLIFSWTFPPEITGSDNSESRPGLIVPQVHQDSTLLVTLVVSDGMAASQPDTVFITVRQLNKQPVAKAGVDQTVDEGMVVTLDGTLSHDVDMLDSLGYIWTSPPEINLSDPHNPQPDFTAPEVQSDTTFLITLIVSDGIVNSYPDSVFIRVKQVNRAPVANAGSDRIVDEGNVVTLDGSLSYDIDLPDSLSYSWNSSPEIKISDSNNPQTDFTAPEVQQDTTFLITLIVSDGQLSSKPDSVLVTVRQLNKPPVADAGPDNMTGERGIGYLDGSNSYDVDNDSLEFIWMAPPEIDLSDPHSPHIEFTAPLVTFDKTFEFILVVSDGETTSEPDTVIFTVFDSSADLIPEPGSNQTVYENEVVKLDGSSSKSVSGDSFTYKWSAPSEIEFSDSASPKPEFIAPLVDKDTSFTITLTLNDGVVNSSPKSMIVFVLNNPTYTATFRVSSNNENLHNARVILNNDTIFTNPAGEAVFENLTTDDDIEYEVTKDNYSIVSDIIDIEQDTIIVIKLQPTKINRYKNRNISIYPNPSTGIVFISGVENYKETTIYIRDITGKLLKTKQIKQPAGKIETDLDELHPGVYFVEVFQNNQRSVNRIAIAR